MAAASPSVTYSDFQGKLQAIISAYYVEHEVSVARERPPRPSMLNVWQLLGGSGCALPALSASPRLELIKGVEVDQNPQASKGCPPSQATFTRPRRVLSALLSFTQKYQTRNADRAS